MDYIVGCQTFMPPEIKEGYFFNVEMTADTPPRIDQAGALKDFLQPHTAEIIDKVVFLIDGSTGDLLWEVPEK